MESHNRELLVASCRVAKNSFHHQQQNYLTICWILLQCWRLCKSGCLKSPGGGKTTLNFVAIKLIGLSEASLVISLKVSTVKGLEFTTDSTSVSSVTSDLLFKLVLCCFSNADSITHTDFVWCSQTPPKWLPEGGLFFSCDPISSTSLQEVWYFVFIPFRKAPLVFWFGLLQLELLSHRISLMFPQHSINLLSAWMNKPVSMFCTTSKYMAQLDRQVNMIPYHFTFFPYCLTIKDQTFQSRHT